MKLCRCDVSILFFLLLLPCLAHAAESAVPKACNPFGEPRPKIPQEILVDKRLDVKVKVFVKSKNMKQLFADLSAKTGVKITANRELWGERPIIYFHNRPLRDVMSEVSATYGYYWLVGGKEGALTYELVEDVKHSRLRDQRKQELADRQNALLMEFMKRVLNGSADTAFMERSLRSRVQSDLPGVPPAVLDQFVQSRSDEFRKMADELRSGAKLFSSFGDDLLRRVLAEGKVAVAFKDLSPDMQKLLYESFKASYDAWNNGDHETAMPFLTSMQDVANSSVYVIRGSDGSGFLCRLHDPGRDLDGNAFRWPQFPYSAREFDDALGVATPPELAGKAGIPKEPAITQKGSAWIGNYQGLRIGDVLQAIAEQSGMDVIADYRFDEGGPWDVKVLASLEKKPLDRATELVCGKWDYSCKAEGGAIRLRRNKWFMTGPLKEPAETLLARCYKQIEQDGIVQLRDAAELGRLPEVQRDWPGFGRVPRGLENLMYSREAVMLWVLLSTSQLQSAATEQGLRVSELSPQQWRSFLDWGAGLKEPLAIRSAETFLAGASIHVSDVPKAEWEEHGVSPPAVASVLSMEIREADIGVIWHGNIETPKPIEEPHRARFAAQRKADAEADMVEIVK